MLYKSSYLELLVVLWYNLSISLYLIKSIDVIKGSINMNITFLIGNGFDIGLKMPTRYENFYEHYCEGISTEDDDADNIINFKKMLISRNKDSDKKIVDWADFEKAFGEHSSDLKIERKADYLARFEDFTEKFNAYLEIVESCTNCSKNIEIGKMMDNAVKMYKHIRKADEDAIDAFRTKFNNDRTYNFVCFNYTKTLDLCINALREILKKENSRNVGSVVHIHGFIEDNMILGVNDPSQITDPALSEDEEVIRELVKPNQNKNSRTGYENAFKSVINKSDLICIYGMSLGETDKKWWDMISTWLSKSDRKLLVILKHEEKYSSRFPHIQDKTIRPIRERFLSFSTLSDSVKQKISEQIFIGINNDVFSMPLFDSEKFKKEIENAKSNSII